VEDGRIRFVPDNWSRTYYEWMRNIQDWCISRQLWWGHRIPAWYDEDGNVYVAHSEDEVREKYTSHLTPHTSLTQDEDVLDTWFSSALWPFSTLGWPEPTPELDKFYPTSVLVTGFDIIFFWVARMIMMGLKFMDDVPFREVYIHGLVRDSDGQKMSKSKGNILDPLDLIDGIDLESLVEKRTSGLMQPQLAPQIEKSTRRHFPDGIAAYGTDSLRFTFASLATQGRDIRFDVGRIQGYRNFCNKLWNATRYVLMSAEAQGLDINNGPAEFGLAERWINTRLAQAIEEVRSGIEAYRFDLAAQAMYEYTWDEYCDWYLELSKITLNDEAAGEAQKRGTLQTLLGNLEMLLRLMHPFIPFITEELWQRITPLIDRGGETVMLQPYPQAQELDTDPQALEEIEWIKAFILGVRRIRAERDIPPGRALAVQVRGGSERERQWLHRNQPAIRVLARLDSIGAAETEPENAVVALAGDMTLLVPLADLIDPEAELERLEKELQKLKNERDRIEKKLGNSQFVERAPAEVVEKEKARFEETAGSITKLEQQYERIKSLTD
jgi:valyl-tRNA synthetase